MSLEFSVRLNVVSGFDAFFRAAREEPSVSTLYIAMLTSDTARNAVLEHIGTLSKLKIDFRWENPNDTALAILLWLVTLAAPEYSQLAANLVDRAPQCWYAKKLAQAIINPPPVASANAEVSESYAGFDINTRKSGEVIILMNLALQPEWGWYHGKTDTQPSKVDQRLLEV
jgi:hypothetical protein